MRCGTACVQHRIDNQGGKTIGQRHICLTSLSTANMNCKDARFLATLPACCQQVNDLWDADLDKKVARTATRPLAAGTLTKTAALGAALLLPSVPAHSRWRQTCHGFRGA